MTVVTVILRANILFLQSIKTNQVKTTLIFIQVFGIS